MTKLDHALALASQGFHVFPLEQGSKLPRIDGFPRRATRDPEQIRRWWTCPVMGHTLDLNVGISTTAFEEHNALLVLDVDNKEGKCGDDTLLALELEGCTFPPTLEQRTPTGGRHLIYRVAAPVKQSAGLLGVGLDVRSRGGYIVGAGSTVPAGEYTVVSREIADAPAWLVERCGTAPEKPPAERLPAAVVDFNRAVKRGIEYLATAPLAVQGDGGDATTFRVAARLKDLGVYEAAAVDLMADHWNDRCSPPWAIDELREKVRNAYRYGKEAPGSAAPEVQFAPVAGPTTEVAAEATAHPFDVLNKNFAFVLAGGGHHILWETTDVHGRYKLEHLSESAFHKKFASWTMQVGNKSKPVTELWMADPKRRSYDGICFMPGLPSPERFYNLWRGFAVEPWPKDKVASVDAAQALAAFLDHAKANVCHGNEVLYHWLIGFFAHLVQRPWEKPLVSLVFRGAKGVGKNALIEQVGALLGSHFLLTSNRRYLVSNFNGHLENCLLFVLDEAFWSGDKQAEGTLKDLITGKTHVIEHKNKEPYTVDNRTRIAVIGNEDWLVPATHDERRFAVFDVGEGRKQDRAFFTSMRERMERGGYRLLLRYLLDYDLSGLDLNQAPQTAALLDQKHASLEPAEQWWLECLSEGRLVGGDFGGEWPREVETERFRLALGRYLRERNVRSRTPDSRSVGRMLSRCAPLVRKKRQRVGETNPYFYHFPPLADCRRAWEKWIGHEVAWE